jgi:hypothetical protein
MTCPDNAGCARLAYSDSEAAWSVQLERHSWQASALPFRIRCLMLCLLLLLSLVACGDSAAKGEPTKPPVTGEEASRLDPFDQWMPFLSNAQGSQVTNSDVPPVRTLVVRLLIEVEVAAKMIDDALKGKGFHTDSNAKIQKFGAPGGDFDRVYATDRGTLFVFLTAGLAGDSFIVFRLASTVRPRS